jgi:hypothetical protein
MYLISLNYFFTTVQNQYGKQPAKAQVLGEDFFMTSEERLSGIWYEPEYLKKLR